MTYTSIMIPITTLGIVFTGLTATSDHLHHNDAAAFEHMRFLLMWLLAFVLTMQISRYERRDRAGKDTPEDAG